ncbi:MAG: zinc-binding dehydrogenase [Saprospiraceae bacterium]
MRAAIIYGIGEKFKVENTTDPILDDSKVIIQTKYCSLNHRDLWISKGQYANLKFPIILGSDICGVYGSKSVLVNPSQFWGTNPDFQSINFKILGLPDSGGLAEKVLVPEDSLFPKPEHLTDLEASTLPLAGLTAYRALFMRAKLKPEDKVFISGIGGGVALFAMQFALSIGCQVFVSSSSDKKIEQAIGLGATGGINYTDTNWNKLFFTNYGGVDVIVDGAGGSDFSKLIKIANSGARISVYGATRGSWNDLLVQQIFWKQLNIFGTTMGSDEDFKNMLQLVSSKLIHPVVDSVFPLSKINDAFLRMEKANQFGKIVIDTAL